MSSVVCCEGRSRRVSVLLLLLLLCLQLMGSCNAGRINRSAFMDGDVRSEVVDPNNRTIWSMFNLTEEQVSRIRNGTNPTGKDETTQATQNRLLDHLAGVRFSCGPNCRLNEIQQRIRIAVSNKQDNEHEKPLHEKAGYPLCNRETNDRNWQQSNNVTLQFAHTVFEQNGVIATNLESAILRLYKVNPKAALTTGQEATSTPAPAVEPLCPEPMLESQIRVTVSIVYQQKKKRKLESRKRTCNTVMLSTTKTGWVEIDVKCALNYWAQPQRAQLPPIVVGLLMIEVHDDEENQLIPGRYFLPPTCDQADIAVPWSVYRSATPLLSMENHTLPKFPRIDVRFQGVGMLSIAHFNSDPLDKNKFESMKRQIYNPSRSRENLNTESTTLNSPTIDNMLENSENASQEKEHVHHHRRRHHHSQQQHQLSDCESSDSRDSSQQSETQHQLRTHHNHYHHRQHHQHHHHKHRHVAQSEE